jgi:hypothetical protein
VANLLRIRVVSKLASVSPYDDDDDWVGTPPEGRYTRDRADPEFWWRQRPVTIAAAGLVVVVIVVIVIAVVH